MDAATTNFSRNLRKSSTFQERDSKLNNIFFSAPFTPYIPLTQNYFSSELSLKSPNIKQAATTRAVSTPNSKGAKRSTSLFTTSAVLRNSKNKEQKHQVTFKNVSTVTPNKKKKFIGATECRKEYLCGLHNAKNQMLNKNLISLDELELYMKKNSQLVDSVKKDLKAVVKSPYSTTVANVHQSPTRNNKFNHARLTNKNYNFKQFASPVSSGFNSCHSCHLCLHGSCTPSSHCNREGRNDTHNSSGVSARFAQKKLFPASPKTPSVFSPCGKATLIIKNDNNSSTNNKSPSKYGGMSPTAARFSLISSSPITSEEKAKFQVAWEEALRQLEIKMDQWVEDLPLQVKEKIKNSQGVDKKFITLRDEFKILYKNAQQRGLIRSSINQPSTTKKLLEKVNYNLTEVHEKVEKVYRMINNKSRSK